MPQSTRLREQFVQHSYHQVSFTCHRFLLVCHLSSRRCLSCTGLCTIISYMRRDSKLSSILHLLLHMAHSDRPLTSDELAGFLQTNPVLVRRTLAGLRERGYVGAVKGHGGGWVVTADLHAVTLRDIYDSVGAPTVFAMGNRDDAPGCLVEQVVNASLTDAFEEAEALLIARFAGITLADLSGRFSARLHARPDLHHAHDKGNSHATESDPG